MPPLLPHGVCFTWDPRLIWLHVLSDGLIALAYLAIPIAILVLLRRRPDLPLRTTISWFGIFIFACAITHVFQIINIWQPTYWLSGWLKAFAAAISLGVAIVLWRMMPLILQVPSIETFRQLNAELDAVVKERTAELTAANLRLNEEVDQRRRAEANAATLNLSLQERVTELQTLLDLLPVGIAIATGPGFRNLTHNQAFGRIFDLTEEAGHLNATVKRDVLDAVQVFVDGHQLSPAERAIQRVADTGEPLRDLEKHIVLPSGEERDVMVAVEPLRNDLGELRGCLATFQDITRRKREENDLRLVMEAAPNAMIVADRDGLIQFANSEAHRLFGYDDGQLRGQPVDTLLPAALRHTHRDQRAAFHQNPSRRAMGAGRELHGLRRDGTTLPIEIGLNPIDLSSGPVVLASIVDLSDRKRAEEERLSFERSLHETQKLESLGVLAGGIAHDFNNLLTGILGHASILRDEDPADANGDLTIESIDQIESSARRAADLCRQLMAYAGKGRFELKALDISQLVTETGKLLNVSVGKIAQLNYELTPSLPRFVGDPTQISQVLMNLVINASEAVEPKLGLITIRTDEMEADEPYLQSLNFSTDLPPGRYLVLEIRDNGSGMDETTRNRIFDPFFTTKFTGRGLGLAAVQGIVHGHGGGIRVYSEPGRGTLFKILLPAAETHAAPKASSAAPFVPTTATETGEILVIDDDASVRQVAQNALTRFGFTVELAASGRLGLDAVIAAPDRFRLVVVDLTMPEMDGDTVIAELRRIAPRLPILLMSGFNEQDTIQRIGHSQPNAFLSKPFSVTSLREKIHRCLASDSPPDETHS